LASEYKDTNKDGNSDLILSGTKKIICEIRDEYLKFTEVNLFDRMVEEVKQTAQEDNDSERILKIEKISRQKQKVISKIQDKLKRLGCDRVEII